jgi:hypothetical protein
VENYIIIRVTEPDSEGSTHTGILRRKIHTIATELGIHVADNIIREGQSTFLWGEPVPYEEAKELFSKVMYTGGFREPAKSD